MFVHGANITQKEGLAVKYTDKESKVLLAEIRTEYDVWNRKNAELLGPSVAGSERDIEIIGNRVALFNQYKDFIDQQKYAEKFDSRSNLHSSVLEEFIYYLFRDLVKGFSQAALIGKAHTFKDLFFYPANYREMLIRPHAAIERKDHDFVIGVSVKSHMQCLSSDHVESNEFEIPAVAIECKTYLDKTMLEGSSTSAEQLKSRNPNALYLVVSEWLKLTGNVNLKKYKVDQIYVLRKQKNTDREYRFLPQYKKNPIYADVVNHLFFRVKSHLCEDWQGGVQYGLDRGYLI